MRAREKKKFLELVLNDSFSPLSFTLSQIGIIVFTVMLILFACARRYGEREVLMWSALNERKENMKNDMADTWKVFISAKLTKTAILHTYREVQQNINNVLVV